MQVGSPQPPVAQDDFVRAVLITFDPTLPAGGVKAQAQQYCDTIRDSPDGWRLCLAKLHEIALAKGSDQVKFWCLLSIETITEKRYATMNEEEKNVLRRSLMLFVRDVIPAVQQPTFIKNKLCAIIVTIVKHDYPKVWPSFFSFVHAPPEHRRLAHAILDRSLTSPRSLMLFTCAVISSASWIAARR